MLRQTQPRVITIKSRVSKRYGLNCIPQNLSAEFLAPSVSVFAYRVFREVFKFIFKFLKFYLAVLGLRCCAGFSLVAVRRLLIEVASIFGEHRLQGTRASVGLAP